MVVDSSHGVVSSNTRSRRHNRLGHALASGSRPRLATLLSPQAPLPAPEELTDRYPDLIARVLIGLLGPT